MPIEVLLTQRFMADTEAALEKSYLVHRLYQARDRQAFVAGVAPAVRGVVTGGSFGVPGSIMDALPALEIIAINGVGTDAVDLNRARARSIRVTTTPGVLTDDVADMAFGLLLAVSRQLCIGDRFVRDGKWPTQTLPLARKVSGKRLGILGLGRVGRAIARRAEGFDMPIAYTDISPISDVPYRFVVNLRDLAVHSEVLIIAASGGPESRGIVDASILDALGRDGILVNVARGGVVDQPALVAALRERRLGGAGLDVFADEPHVPEALWSLDNVVLQPHQASATVETRLAMGEMVLANLAAHFAGKPLPSAVV
jgi:hydroxypyruvate reductase